MGLHIMAGTPDAEANPGLRGMIRRGRRSHSSHLFESGHKRSERLWKTTVPTYAYQQMEQKSSLDLPVLDELSLLRTLLQDRRKQAQRILPPQPRITWNSALVMFEIDAAEYTTSEG